MGHGSVLHGEGRGKGTPIPRCRSGDADGVRASKVEHSVEDLGGDGDLGGPGLVAVETQPVTDDLLPARELALNAGSFVIAAVALPSHSPFPGDRLDVAIALGGLGIRRGAEHGISTGWDHHRRSRMALVQSGVHAGSVIATVAQEELDWLGDLVEQGAYLGGVIDVAVGQDGSDDPAGHRVKADVQLAPGTPLAGAVFLNQPFARTPSFRPELSTSRWIAPPVVRSCAGSSSV